jgi:hypothetical protein
VTFEDDFRDLMPDTVTIEPVASVGDGSGYAKRQYGTAVTYQCRIREKVQRFTSLEGHITWSKHKVWVAPAADGTFPALDQRARVTFADGTQPQMLAIEHLNDEDGLHHVVLWFGDTARVGSGG